jgi:hypothetical protein
MAKWVTFTLLPTSGRFMFGERPRKPTILNSWFQLRNIKADLSWFGQQYLAILLGLKWPCIVQLLPVTTWAFHVTTCVLWSRCFVKIMQFFIKKIRPWETWRCTSTSSLASTIVRLKYPRNWSVLEGRVRSRFPPPSSLKQLEIVLREEG